MSVDDRIREALGEEAETYVPQVETSLQSVRSRGRQAQRCAAMVALTAVAAAALVAAGVWGRVDRPAAPSPAGDPAETATSAEAEPPTPLRGSITAEVEAPSALAGRWTLELNGNGTMAVDPPAGYAGVVAGALFTADGTMLRTTVLGEDVCAGDGTGIYEWLAVGDRIEITTVSDLCRPRVRFFEEPVWTSSTDVTARR